MTVEQFIADLDELVDAVRTRVGQNKGGDLRALESLRLFLFVTRLRRLVRQFAKPLACLTPALLHPICTQCRRA